MPDMYDPPLPRNYVRMVASEPDLYGAFFRGVTDFTPYSANLKPLSLQIFVKKPCLGLRTSL